MSKKVAVDITVRPVMSGRLSDSFMEPLVQRATELLETQTSDMTCENCEDPFVNISIDVDHTKQISGERFTRCCQSVEDEARRLLGLQKDHADRFFAAIVSLAGKDGHVPVFVPDAAQRMGVDAQAAEGHSNTLIGRGWIMTAAGGVILTDIGRREAGL